MASFGVLLKRHREAAGLTQEALAAQAGLSIRGISDLERGVNRLPRGATVGLLAQALGLSGPERARFEAAARGGASIAAPIAESGRSQLIGRMQELALLETQFGAKGPPVLLLAGPPGIGKSRLLQEAAQRAQILGWRVLAGGCQRRGGQQPYAPLLEALERHIHRLQPAQLRMALKGCAWLVRLLPELATGPIEPLPEWALLPVQERRLTFAAVGRFLANVTGASGTLLVLDDLQWAGVDALDLLTTLLRTPTGTPLRVVGAYRDTEVGPRDPLSGMLADLIQAEAVLHHPLGPLTTQDAGELFDNLLGESRGGGADLRQQVLQRAGGVPFFLVSYARGLQRAGLHESTASIPWDLRQSIGQRVASLPAEVQDVLGVAAITGRTATHAVLGRVTARPDHEMVAALEGACRARLLEEAGQATYQFAHDVIREVVEADLSTVRRVLLHRSVAAAIEEIEAGHLPEQYERLAYHYAQGEEWAKALNYLVLAGDRAAAAYANQGALASYAKALELCEQLGEAALPTVVAVAQRLGALNNGLGNMPAAVADFDHLLDAAQRLGDRHTEGMALVQRGMSQFWNHDLDAADQSLRAALAVAAEDLDDVQYAASVWLGGMYQATDRWADGEPILRAVEEMGPRVGDPFTRVWWSLFLGNRLGWEGRYAEAIALYEGARDDADRYAFTSVGLRWMEAVVRGGNGEYRQAFALLDQVLATCGQVGELIWQARALNQMGWLYSELQDHQRALEWNTRSVQAALELPSHDAEIYSNAVINVADNLLALGQCDAAEQQLQLVERVVRHRRPEERLSHERFSQHFYHSYGEIWLARGMYEHALTCADECLAIAEPGSHRKNIVKGHRLRAEVFMAQGHLAEAERELDSALAVARPLGNPPQLWKTLVTLGDLRTAQDRPDEARLAYREALIGIDGVAEGLGDAPVRVTFLASDHVRHIRQRAG